MAVEFKVFVSVIPVCHIERGASAASNLIRPARAFQLSSQPELLPVITRFVLSCVPSITYRESASSR